MLDYLQGKYTFAGEVYIKLSTYFFIDDTVSGMLQASAYFSNLITCHELEAHFDS
jgi:hypothetical protein